MCKWKRTVTVSRIPDAVYLAILLLGIIAAPSRLGAISWTDDVNVAMHEAEQAGKPVLLLVTAGTWCDPCKWLEDNTLSESSVKSLVNAGFVPVRLLDTEPGWERWGVRRVPTILILDAGGEELARIPGAITAAVLQERLAPLAASLMHDPATVRRIETEPVEPDMVLDTLRGAVFRIGSAGTLWNDGGANWYSQDAGLPPRLEEYDRDDTFLYLRDRTSGTLLGVPLERPRRGGRAPLWRWNLDARDWEEAAVLERLD